MTSSKAPNLRYAWLIGLALPVLSALAVQIGSRFSDQFQPQNFGLVSNFEVTAVNSQAARPLKKTDLDNRVWIANFIYTSCSGPCPLMSASMKNLDDELPQEIQLVSFSVDPDIDTPQRLERYAHRFPDSSDRWFFARADKKELYRIVYEGFHLAMAENKDAPEETRVLHSTKFALVAPGGVIAGYYDSSSENALQKLKRDARSLLKKQTIQTARAARESK